MEAGQAPDMTVPPKKQDVPTRFTCAQARERARQVLVGYNLPAVLVDDVLVVVSELVSNAERHAEGLTGFDITVRAGQIVVEVSDRSPRPPRHQPASPDTPGGFGWRVVTTLAPATHLRLHPGGKTITALFPLPASSPPAAS